MIVDMLMPQMGESITEATVARWLKKVGDFVERDETILEISTDKVDSEIPAPASGVLTEILFQEGDLVPVKTKIATIDSAAKAPEGAPKAETAAEKPAEVAPSAPSNAPVAPPTSQSTAGEATASPLVKNLASQHGVPLSELSQIAGSGSGGRVTKQDFLTYLERRGAAPSSGAAPKQQSLQSTPKPASAAAGAMPSGSDWGPDGTKLVPMDRMRQAIADHMVRSKQTSPHVYSIQEVDVSKISQWRAQNRGAFKKVEGFNLSYTPFFLLAAVRAIQQFPIVNSSVQEKTVVMKRHVNLGCAVALGNSGLIVPVIHKAEELTLVGIARHLNDITTRARDRKLLPDDVMGGTFTVTNAGVFGTIIGTPIINQPQVAIMFVGAIQKRPVVIDNMIGIREMCYLTLSYDHRIIDGSLGGQFLAYVRNFLESWDLEQPLA